MNRKATLLDLMAQAYEEEKRFMAALTEEERSRAGTLEQWAAKDVIAHNAAWKGRMAENLHAVSQGRAPRRTEDYDRENVTLFEEHRAKTWDEVMELADRAYLGLVEQVESLEGGELASREVFPWQGDRPLWRLIVGNGYNHPFIHMAEYHRTRGDSPRSGELIGEMARSLVDLDDSPTWQGVVVSRFQSCDGPMRAVLQGVPRVGFGVLEEKRDVESCPFPSCLRACLEFVREDFYAYEIIHKEEVLDNEAYFRRRIIESIRDQGRPVLAFGVIGPPECCIIAGYDEYGDVVIGWNYFQNFPEFNAGIEFEPSGYFRKRDWFTDTESLTIIGEKQENPPLVEIYRKALKWALKVVRTPMVDAYGHERRNGLGRSSVTR